MAQSLRNLQIFRNGELLTGSVAYVKDLINTAFTGDKIVLNDGEPISIRYKETNESSEIKSLFGVAYVPANGTPSILWNESGITINTDPKNNTYVTLNNDVDESGNYTLTVAANTISVNDATAAEGETPAVDGLATALDVKTYVTEQIGKIPTVPEYTIKPLETANKGYLKSYQLFKGADAVENAVIDIPKDYLVKEASIKTVETENVPEVGYKVGDKYFDFVINTKDDTTEDQHLYINAKDLVDTYNAGDGISIDDNNIISVKITEDEQYIAFDENGAIHTTEALKTAIESAGKTYTKGDDIDITTDNKINVSLSNSIESSVNIGNIKAGDIIDQGASLQEILSLLLQKEFDATSTKPSVTLTVDKLQSNYPVGSKLGELTITHKYTDGYFSPSTGYPLTKWISYNGTNPLYAGCDETENGTTYYYNSDSNVITLDNNKYTNNTSLTAGSYSFYCKTQYGASQIKPKTNFGNDSDVVIAASTAKSNLVSFNVYYRSFVKIVETVNDDYTTYLTSENNKYITSNNIYSASEYTIPENNTMLIILPENKGFTIASALGSPATNEFTKITTITDGYDVNYNVYSKQSIGTSTIYKNLILQ